VIVQKAGQVNIAAEGGQQVNVQKQCKKRTKKGSGTTGRPATCGL
jgi:hypothetical protein